MIKDEEIMSFLHYIGITKRKQQAKIVEVYRTSEKKQIRESEFRRILDTELKLADETIERITNYLIYPQKREKTYRGVWGFKKVGV